MSARAWGRAARRRKKHLEAVTGRLSHTQSQQCAPDFASLAQMLLENFLRVRPSFSAAQAVRAEMAQRGGGFRTKQTRLPPGNDGRPDKGAFLATAHTSSNKQNAFSLEIIIATVGVVPVAAHASVDRQRINSSGATAPVAAVDDDVASGEVRQNLRDELVHNFSGLHHKPNASRLRQSNNHLFDRVAADDGFAPGAALQKVVHLEMRVNAVHTARKQSDRGRRTLEVVLL